MDFKPPKTYSPISPIAFLQTITRHKTLIKEFIKKEIRSRFIGSFGGKLWLIITPLSQIFIFYFVFGVILKMRLSAKIVGTDSFVEFLLAGLLPWLSFSEAVNRGTGVMIANASIINKIVMPLEILPFTEVACSFILNFIGFGLFLVYLSLQGYASPTWFLLPALVLILFLFTQGLVSFLSAITVFFRDAQQLMNLVIQAWFYMTPIIYPLYMIPERYQVWVKLNPMLPFIQLFQDILLKHVFSLRLFITATLIALLSHWVGSTIFKKLSPSFNDVL